MHHLTLESLARLVDEAPTNEEAAHLRDCLVCRRELDEMRQQTELLAELPLLDPRPAAWEALEARLLGEGMLRAAAPSVAPERRPHGFVRSGALRLAASLALFLMGGAAGALLLGRDPTPTSTAALPVPRVSPPAGRLEPAAPEVIPVEGSAAPTSGAVRLAANGPDPVAPQPARRRTRPNPVSAAVRSAEADLAEAEAAYLGALQRYAELADPASGADPATRLEALERLVEMSARALDRSPDDARLNGYHLAAVSERDMLRRQIQRAVQTTWF